MQNDEVKKRVSFDHEWVEAQIMRDVRVAPGKTMDVGEVSVENKTGNSIIVRYDKERKTVLLVDCCLEEQGK